MGDGLIKSNVTTFLTKKAAFLVSLHFELGLHFVLSLQSSVRNLYLVCILYPSVVCSLQSAFCTGIGMVDGITRESQLPTKVKRNEEIPFNGRHY